MQIKQYSQENENYSPPYLLITLVLLILASLSYSEIFHHEFIAYDDTRIIINNAARYDGLNINNLRAIFISDFPREEPLLVRDLSYLINTEIFGLNNPGGFLLGNLFLHVLCAIVVYKIGLILFPSRPITALLASILFVTHPLHSESIAWISARKDTLYSLFSMLAFIGYVNSFSKNNSSSLLYSVLFFILALLSKAAAISFFPIILSYRITIGRHYKLKLNEVIYSICIITLTLLFVVWYTHILTDFGILHQQTERSWLNWFLVTIQTLTLYIKRLLFPYGLSAIYTFPSTLTVYSHPEFLLFSLLLWPSLFAYFTLNKSSQKPTYLFLFLWFIAGFIPYLDFAQVGIYMADRYAYLSSVPFLLLCSKFFTSIYYKINTVRKKSAVLLLILFAGFTAGAVFQTRSNVAVWQNSITFWENVKKQTPSNLASYAALMGEHIKQFHNTNDPERSIHLENAKKTGEKAMEIFTYKGNQYEKALYLITTQLGQIAWLENDSKTTDYYFNLTWNLNPNFIQARYLYAQILATQGRLNESLKQIGFIEKYGKRHIDNIYLSAAHQLKSTIKKREK